MTTPQRVKIPTTIKRKIQQRANQCIKIARKLFDKKFPNPAISYFLDGSSAACAIPAIWLIDINSKLLIDNIDYYLTNTIPHEVAHLVDLVMNENKYVKQKRINAHGKTWKEIVKAFGAKPTTGHTMDISSVCKYIAKKHVYKCPKCGTKVTIGSKHHSLIQKNRGDKIQIIKCGHFVNRSHYVGLSSSTKKLMKQRLNSKKNKR